MINLSVISTSKVFLGKILLGITGSISAYKSAELARLLVKANFDVRCILSDSAEKFVGKLLFEAITGNPVSDSLWENIDPKRMEHISLADWCDLFVIAPCTAHTIGGIANGLGDSALLATVLASKAPLLIAPAMNVNMWENPAVQENLTKLKNRGVNIVEPGEGELACGWNGSGRLAEPEEIFKRISECAGFVSSKKVLSGKTILISAGPTREPIDDVRFISNRSSGKMGLALAKEAFELGAQVLFVHGPISEHIPDNIISYAVKTADEMNNQILKLTFLKDEINLKIPKIPRPDVIVMTAAVADFKVKNRVKGKIKRGNGIPEIVLEPNTDILANLGSLKADFVDKSPVDNHVDKNYQPILVGFAVESGDEQQLIEEIKRKLKTKKCDIVIGNLAGEAFEGDTNRVWIYNKDNSLNEIPYGSKNEIAKKIWSVGIIPSLGKE